MALRTEFSTRRAEKKILWGQSKRLKTGTIVALSPVEDKFKTKCLVAVVASRVTLELIVEPPAKPSIQIFIGDPGNLEIDPQQEWIMVEASGGYWEASRHTLRALQKLHGERYVLSDFPLWFIHLTLPAFPFQNILLKYKRLFFHLGTVKTNHSWTFQ